MSPKEQVFADFVELNEFAASLKKHPRTPKRWANQPDGLPVARIGNKDYVHLPTAREWVMSRVRKPNPRRAAGDSQPAA